MFTLDSNVVSELMRAAPHAGVEAFVAGLPEAWLSVITLHEVRYGVQRMPSGKRQAEFMASLVDIQRRYGEKIVAVDQEIAQAAADLRALASDQRRVLALGDALIGGTALVRQHTLITRNDADFHGLGIPLINPWRL